VRGFVPLIVALVVYPVAGWLIRLLLTVITMPLVNVPALLRSRGFLGGLRFLVGTACGAGALGAALWCAGEAPRSALLGLTAAVAVMAAAFHLRGGWALRATPQFADDLLSFAGEELGVLGTLAFWLSAS
jgi:hypothetical protein